MNNLTSTFVPPDSQQPDTFLDGLLSVFLGPLISAVAGLFVPIFGLEGGAVVTGAAGILGAGVESTFKDPSLPCVGPEPSTTTN